MSFSLKRAATSQLSLWLVVTLFGAYFLYNLKDHLKFGIDLVGGTYITLDVQVEKALENEPTT